MRNFILISFFASITYAGVIGTRPSKLTKELDDLDKNGVRIEKGGRMILNRYMKKNKLPENENYTITFSCQHKKSFDQCKVIDAVYKKN